MDVRWLEDVLVLLEEGNMSRAAARRNITQPAFSRRVRSFEHWLGSDILTRGSNSVEISDALAANEGEIRALIARIRDLKGRIAHFDPASSTIAIAAPHALISSVFSDILIRARRAFPALKFRLRAGNQVDCVSMFLRGDTSMLLSYETEETGPLPFDSTVRREVWGSDQLIAVVGGKLRYLVQANGALPEEATSIVYPAESFFGHILRASKSPFGTAEFSGNPVCESAFSNGIFEMVKKGLGVGWLPHSMCYKEVEQGSLVSLSGRYGRVPLRVSLYSNRRDQVSNSLQDSLTKRAAP
ncbi:LysR family transcriptional regulator [Oceanibium sediminis]|uniref:LysR family transcriptional regulator n=1 Tax=Oceanibium sediminis TaxID=2026339 RepID=UPI000DD40610|nr:LysR family transcriptional regulator [Oceanibium sediminis]